MKTVIKKVASKAEMKKFIRFNYEMYKDNKCSVPDLYEDMLNTFSSKNPAMDFCDAEYFLAYQDDKVVGRVAAIINHRANERWEKKTIRFGWIDFVDDTDVSKALIEVVEEYGKSHGMDNIEGPLGFTDMDAEGMLVEGFDVIGTMATIYNYPYYASHMAKLGMEKAADWVEFRLLVPDKVPEKMVRIGEIVQKKFGLRSVKITSKKMLKEKNYGQRIFDLINEGYKDLFGFVSLTQKQIDEYVKTYLGLLNLEMVSLIETSEGELVGVGISMDSLSVALQKAKGKLFPLGWYHLLRVLRGKHPDTLDLLLVAIKPEYQNKGVNALLFTDLLPIYIQNGYKYCESNPELELNTAVQKMWDYFETDYTRRRRCFKKMLK
ncbi:MAG: N-acetyltransferase [Alistipes sp.]|nr:N-acetyltransferase [Candidatus Alistipes equi]